MQGHGKIDSVDVMKSGVGARGAWIIFKVMVDGQRFTTFDASLQTKVGQIIDFEYTSEIRQGKNGSYESKTISAPSQNAIQGANFPSQPAPRPAQGAVNGGLVVQRLDVIIALLKTMAHEQGERDFLTNEPIAEEPLFTDEEIQF
jgi:hypothetical protein